MRCVQRWWVHLPLRQVRHRQLHLPWGEATATLAAGASAPTPPVHLRASADRDVATRRLKASANGVHGVGARRTKTRSSARAFALCVLVANDAGMLRKRSVAARRWICSQIACRVSAQKLARPPGHPSRSAFDGTAGARAARARHKSARARSRRAWSCAFALAQRRTSQIKCAPLSRMMFSRCTSRCTRSTERSDGASEQQPQGLRVRRTSTVPRALQSA